MGRMSGAGLGAGSRVRPIAGTPRCGEDHAQHDGVARDKGFAVLAYRPRRSGLISGARLPLMLAAFGIATWTLPGCGSETTSDAASSVARRRPPWFQA